MSKTIFFKNLEYFQTNLGYSEDEFFTSGKGNHHGGVIPISKNAYARYRNGTLPRPYMLREIAAALTKAISKDEALSAKFPNPLLPYDLKETDLSLTTAPTNNNPQNFYSYKMLGSYLCYYVSTNCERTKTPRYGVIQITATDKTNVMDICGVFSLKNYDDALKLHASLNENKKLSEEIAQTKRFSLFTGSLYLTPSLMWANLVNETQNDFLSVSFDLSNTILSKKPEKPYLGSRGIAISSTSGRINQSVTFPFVITKKPITVCSNKLIKYLHFAYTKVKDEDMCSLAEEIITLLSSVLNSNALSPETRTKLLAATLAEKLLSYFEQHTYNSHYFLAEEMVEFYDNIIFPIKKTLVEDNDDATSE